MIDTTPVTHSFKVNGGKVVHLVNKAFTPGQKVKVLLDWQRRFDHMQQHSGQHLLTAICEKLYGYKTTSWNLGPKISFIELDVENIPSDHFKHIEDVINEKIRGAVPLKFHIFKRGSEELKEVSMRLELPKEEFDSIRVVEIDGIDLNPCCGTHVSNLGHLQALKLLYSEKGKKKKTNLYFVVGQRLLSYLDNCLSREKNLTTILKCSPEEHVSMCEKLQKSLKLTNKNCQSALRDLAVLEAKQFNNLPEKPKYFSLHRKDAEAEYLSIFAKEVASKDVILFLTVGDKQGHMLLSGPLEIVSDLGPKVCDMLGGKGSVQHGRFQAKVSDLKPRPKAEAFIRENLGIIG